MELRFPLIFVVALFLLSASSQAAPTPKKKGGAPKVVSPPAPSDPPELKPAPVMQPVAAPPPVVVAAPAAVEAEPELTPLPKLPPPGGLSVQATGGVVTPFSGLKVGGRAALRASYWFGTLPIAASLGVAFEQHTSRSAVFFAPPAGGLDEATLENQTLLPFEVGAQAALFRDGKNRVHLGASYGLLAVWSQTGALGDTVLERGVGHEVAGEAGFTRRLGMLELAVAVRYSVRKTAVGARTASIELPWYQTFGVVAGLGFCSELGSD